jgi:TolB-like protein/Flp pilus assembly protein TadD
VGLSVIIRSNLENSAAKQAVNPPNFFSELKRRNVYKVAIAYAVVAWLLMQIATQVFPFLEIPNWAIRLVIMLIVIGFPIALVIAWAFELTPEGIKRTEAADASRQHSRGGAWIYIVAVGAALSVGLFFLGRYTAPKIVTKTGESVGSGSLPDKSIAVLPFENLSEEKANAYFADGIQEEILTRLSKIADLKVISRTSTQRFKSAPDNLLEIAKQLGVANILEGSVQRSADQVRVNVQLIKAATDAHLWADTFDRKVTDVFAVESEIAKAVADTLQAKLSGTEQSAITARPTENSEAHDLYLKGRYFFGKRTADDLKRAIDYFNQALAKDSNYAPAYAGLADSYVLLPQYSRESSAELFPKARAAAEKALALDNTLSEAHASLGLLLATLSTSGINLRESEREFERAIALNPNYAPAHHWYGFGVLLPLGEFDRAIAEVKRALELDPFSAIMNANLGFCYLYARRYSEAIAQFRKAAELDPSSPAPHLGLGEAYELSGQREQAITEYERAGNLFSQLTHIPPTSDNFLPSLAGRYVLKGERAKALQLLDHYKGPTQRGAAPDFAVALDYVRLGDNNKAIDWLERSYQNKEPGFLEDIKVNPLLDPLRGDPRFEALVEKIVPLGAK